MSDLNQAQLRYIAEQVAEQVYERLRRGDDVVLPESLNAKQVARILKCSEKKLEAMRATRTGPVFYNIGRAVRYEAADVRAYQQRQRVENVGRPSRETTKPLSSSREERRPSSKPEGRHGR